MSEPTHSAVRELLTTPIAADYLTERELTAQTGHAADDWPPVIVKELLDNAADAAEESGSAPVVRAAVDAAGIAVADDGPGIPAEAVEGAADLASRASTRAAYVAPDRGAQGNATKTIIGMPYALADHAAGEHAPPVVIEARGVRHELRAGVEPLSGAPVVAHDKGPSDVKIGTRVAVAWPDSACSRMAESAGRILQVVDDYAALNPHMSLSVDLFGQRVGHAPTDPAWRRWHPGRPTSPHWYDAQRFTNLLGKLAAADRGAGRDRTVRELAATFDGMSGSAKQKSALAEAGLSGARLSDLAGPGGIDAAAASRLLRAMTAATHPPKPAALGVIPPAHLAGVLARHGCDPDTVKVAKVEGVDGGRPFLWQVAFGVVLDGEAERRLIVGLNNSPAINPLATFPTLDGMLGGREVDEYEPVVAVVHVAMPGVAFADRGKARAELPPGVLAALARPVDRVTAAWSRQRRAEHRDAAAAERRADTLARARRASRPSVLAAVYDALADAYAKAAGGVGMATARMIYYVVRVPVLEATGRATLGYDYFSRLLVEYMRENPETTAGWLVAYDNRGELIEPHTGHRVGLGTVDLLAHRDLWSDGRVPGVGAPLADPRVPTVGPRLRYAAVLFCEKAGLLHVLQHAGIDRRYDLALMSTKGMPTTAGRDVVAAATAAGVPTLVMRDFDKSGFSIARTLSASNGRYEFDRTPDVRDLGLRLADARAYGLESEPVETAGNDPRPNMRANGATEEEADVIAGELRYASKRGRATGRWHGRRTELNAFSSDALVRWVEAKLAEQGIAKVVPPADVLADAYRRAVASKFLNERMPAAVRRAVRDAASAGVPRDLEARVRRHLAGDAAIPWDEAVSAVVEAAL